MHYGTTSKKMNGLLSPTTMMMMMQTIPYPHQMFWFLSFLGVEKIIYCELSPIVLACLVLGSFWRCRSRHATFQFPAMPTLRQILVMLSCYCLDFAMPAAAVLSLWANGQPHSHVLGATFVLKCDHALDLANFPSSTHEEK